MTGDKPEGGSRNYDAENGKKLPRNFPIPPGRRFVPDAATRDAMTLVREHFSDHFGDLESFDWAVTREDALAALQHFVTSFLPQFGDYQDAMKAGQDFLFHSVLSPYINIGLLIPKRYARPHWLPTTRARRHYQQSRGLFGRFWAGASMCAASTG